MTTYESTFICSPELPAEKIDEIVEKVKKVVDHSHGSVVAIQQLGKKKLAYPVKKFREGNYVFLELSGPGELIHALETFYRVNDSVIRYLTVKIEKKKKSSKTPEKVQAEPKEVKPNEPNELKAAGAE